MPAFFVAFLYAVFALHGIPSLLHGFTWQLAYSPPSQGFPALALLIGLLPSLYKLFSAVTIMPFISSEYQRRIGIPVQRFAPLCIVLVSVLVSYEGGLRSMVFQFRVDLLLYALLWFRVYEYIQREMPNKSLQATATAPAS